MSTLYRIDDGTYVRNYYRVPAFVGGRILFQDVLYTILGFHDQYLVIEMDGVEVPIHPKWRVEYLPEEET